MSENTVGVAGDDHVGEQGVLAVHRHRAVDRGDDRDLQVGQPLDAAPALDVQHVGPHRLGDIAQAGPVDVVDEAVAGAGEDQDPVAGVEGDVLQQAREVVVSGAVEGVRPSARCGSAGSARRWRTC